MGIITQTYHRYQFTDSERTDSLVNYVRLYAHNICPWLFNNWIQRYRKEINSGCQVQDQLNTSEPTAAHVKVREINLWTCWAIGIRTQTLSTSDQWPNHWTTQSCESNTSCHFSVSADLDTSLFFKHTIQRRIGHCLIENSVSRVLSWNASYKFFLCNKNAKHVNCERVVKPQISTTNYIILISPKINNGFIRNLAVELEISVLEQLINIILIK